VLEMTRSVVREREKATESRVKRIVILRKLAGIKLAALLPQK
jgi:hypothetical protein